MLPMRGSSRSCPSSLEGHAERLSRKHGTNEGPALEAARLEARRRFDAGCLDEASRHSSTNWSGRSAPNASVKSNAPTPGFGCHET
jgi:hypothetical protein